MVELYPGPAPGKPPDSAPCHHSLLGPCRTNDAPTAAPSLRRRKASADALRSKRLHSQLEARIIAGQYLGFGAILLVSIVGALGASLLPEKVVAYLGLVPLLLGVRAAVAGWRDADEGADEPLADEPGGPTTHNVAAVTFANGGDNIGVYIPVFAAAGNGGIAIYSAVFLVLGRALARCRPVPGHPIAHRLGPGPLGPRSLARRSHHGVILLVHGGAFGL